MEEVVERICVNENTSHSRIDEGTPPPSMVLPRQLKVEQSYADEGCHDDEEDEGKEQDPEEGVNLMSPHRSKNVVEFDVNRRKWQESRNNHLKETAAVPRHLRGYFASHLRRASWGIEVMACVVLRRDASQDGKGAGDQGVDRSNGEDGRERQCTRGPVEQCDGIHPQENRRHRGGEETGRKKNTAHPRLAIHLEIKSRRHEATNGACKAVENDHSSEDGPAPCRGDEAGQCQSEEEEGGNNELHSSPDGGAKEDGKVWEAEDIAVNQLPPRLNIVPPGCKEGGK